MPIYTYKARQITGRMTQGTMEAADLKTVNEKLRQERLIALEVKELAPPSGLMATLAKLNPLRAKVTSKDLVIFSRQLSTLIDAGVPLVQGLGILTQQIENKAFKTVIDKLKTDIESGSSIHEAMAKHPEAFEELYVSMVRAGELGGVLDVTLDRLASYLEAAEDLKSKVRGAMIYPAVVFSIAIGVVIFLMVFIIPRFKSIFESFDAELPFATKLMINISSLTAKFFWILPVYGVAFWQSLKWYRKKEEGAKKIDQFLLKIPILGGLLKKVAIAKFTRTMATLIKSGVNILEALEAVSKIAGNKVIELALLETKKSVQEGHRLIEPLKKASIFPPMVIQMIAIGEESGNLEKMLNKIADFYDSEIDAAVKGLTSLIEPIVIVFLGLVVGGIVISMFLPMFDIAQVASEAGPGGPVKP